MSNYICIEKIRNKGNQIIAYILEDEEGNKINIDAKNFKIALQHKQIKCNNLTLTKNGRVIDKKIKGYADITANMIHAMNRYKALSFISNEEDVEQVCAKYKLLTNANIYHFKHRQIYLIDYPNQLKFISAYQLRLKQGKDRLELFRNMDFTSIDLSNLSNTLLDMSHLFSHCKARRINFGNIDTQGVTKMNGMFYATENLEEIDFTGINTKAVVDMSHMFAWCNAKYLNLSNFDTTNVANMQKMFYHCKAEVIDLSNFNTENCKYMEHMFTQCNAKKIITNDKRILHKWEIDKNIEED